MGYAVTQFVESLRDKLEGCGFDSRMGHWDFMVVLILPAAPWLQPLTGLSTGSISWGVKAACV